MANRVLLGKSTNSNLGHSSGKFGLYISRAGDDVTSCTADQLVFNTDNVGSVSGNIDVGQFQIVPTSGTNATVNVTVAAGSSATVSHTNLGTGNLLYTNNAAGLVATQGSSVTLTKFLNGAYTGTTSGTLNNLGTTAVTLPVAVIKGISTASLF